ncbi:MAG: glycosyltransferase family 2 protein [Solirubrobacteraceae bacterium]
MTAETPQISVVMPTFNRLAALTVNFSSVRQLLGISEIVVVVDGSTDGTTEWLQGLDDPRVRMIQQSQRGAPAARNTGIAAARGDWILLTEDDCHLPQDFVVILLEAARARDAQIVGAPWVHVDSPEQIVPALERGRREAQARIRLGTHPSVFPADDVSTPFLNGIFLAAREVFEVVRFDESLRGNAWREETALFLDATEAGFRCLLTPRTASFQLGQWGGGNQRPRLSYESWVIRNNWRFLCTHRHALERLGEIDDPFTAQARFVAERLAGVAGGYSRARWRALIGRRTSRKHGVGRRS